MCTRLGSSSSSLLSTWSSSSLVSSIVSGLGYTIFLNFVLAKGPEIMKTCTNWMELNLLSFKFQCKLSRYEIKVKYVMGISESDALSSISVISTRALSSVSVSLPLLLCGLHWRNIIANAEIGYPSQSPIPFLILGTAQLFFSPPRSLSLSLFLCRFLPPFLWLFNEFSINGICYMTLPSARHTRRYPR